MTQGLMLWRPVLLVAACAAAAVAVAVLGQRWDLPTTTRVAFALAAGIALVLPVALQELRGRALVGLIPAVALLVPWDPRTFALLVAGALALAVVLGRRGPGGAPSGYKLRQLQAQLERYPLLLDACLALAGSRDRDQVAATLASEARRLGLGVQTAAVFLPHGGSLVCRAQNPRPGGLAPTAGPDEAYVAEEARSLVRRHGGVVTLVLPLRGDRREGSIRGGGVLWVVLDHDPALDDYNMELQEALARLGGIALATADLLVEARDLALHDSLTGLFGRHEFRRRLMEQVANAERRCEPLSLVVCDMDHLKAYNDTHGHPAGDQALRVVATCIDRVAKEGAVGCRWGGEEFALVLPGCDQALARAVAEGLREAIANAIPEPDHPDRRISASLGVAERRPGESPDQLVERADQACYAAKENGRNRVEIGR